MAINMLFPISIRMGPDGNWTWADVGCKTCGPRLTLGGDEGMSLNQEKSPIWNKIVSGWSPYIGLYVHVVRTPAYTVTWAGKFVVINPNNIEEHTVNVTLYAHIYIYNTLVNFNACQMLRYTSRWNLNDPFAPSNSLGFWPYIYIYSKRGSPSKL